MMRAALALTVVVIAVTVGPAAGQGVSVPLMNLALATTAGMQANLQSVAATNEAEASVKVTFTKTEEDRRLLALAAMPRGSLLGAKALVARYRLELTEGAPPRLAMVVFDSSGGNWYALGPRPLETGTLTEARVSLGAMRPTDFSEKTGALDWTTVTRVWVGLVMDGKLAGSLLLTGARVTDEPYKPTQPVRLTGSGPGQWGASQDGAVKSTLTTPAEGPDGKPCLKYDFTVPGGAHMYAIPTAGIVAGELEGYTLLRFKYRALIPQGMRLLVTLGERGGPQWFCEPPGPWSAEWTTMALPLSQFKWASWSTKDPNGKLDVEDLGSVMIGTHGVPAAGGPGLIMATDIELVP